MTKTPQRKTDEIRRARVLPRTVFPSAVMLLESFPGESMSLLTRIAAGETAAVQECVDTYSALVWSIARRFTRSTPEAEDAVQEVFIELWKNSSRYDPQRASEKVFVAMIARRRLIDRFRMKKRRPVTESADDFDFPQEDHRVIERSAEAALALRVLSQLRPEQRQTMILSIYHGMTHQEIAEASEMPLGTVKSHITRGLKAVRQQLFGAQPSVRPGVVS